MTTTPAVPRTTPTSFEAGSDQLTYNFEPYLEGVKGVIPEPTSDQIGELIEFLRQFMPVTKDEDGKASLDIATLSERMQGKDAAEVEAILNTAVSRVCSKVFTPAQLAALPYRVKARFYGWLLGSLLSPEA